MNFWLIFKLVYPDTELGPENSPNNVEIKSEVSVAKHPKDKYIFGLQDQNLGQLQGQNCNYPGTFRTCGLYGWKAT